jgi:hypothetical protein
MKMYIKGARQQRNTEELATAGMHIACRAAKLYLENHKLQATDEALAPCICSHVRARMREALAASKEAMSAGLSQWIDTAFGTVMLQAGIEAAKEAGLPSDLLLAPTTNYKPVKTEYLDGGITLETNAAGQTFMYSDD